MKILITIFLFIIFFSYSFAQDVLFPAYPSEIIGEGVIGDRAYFKNNNRPFTGILVNEKTNKKIGEYNNGYKNGVFTKWFTNGQKKSSYAYKNGNIIDGKYITYFENGNEKEEIYKGGLKISEGIYKDEQFYVLSTEYFPGAITKKREGYLKNGRKNGFWVGWYESGQIKSKGYFKDGMEDSLWTWWYENGDKKKEVIYEKGYLTSLIFENKVDPKFSIKAKLKPNAYLFRSLSGVEEDTVYIMVSFNFNQKYSTLKNNILGALYSRFRPIRKDDIPIYGKKMLNYSMEFSKPLLFTVFDNGRSNIFGVWTYKEKTGYRGKATVTMEITNLKNGIRPFYDTITGQSKINKKRADAYSIASSLLYQTIIDQIYRTFKIKTIVKKILETDGDGYAETISIMCGKNLSIKEGFIFEIFSENDLYNKLGEVEVDETNYNTSECEVNEGGKIIANSMRSGIKLVAIFKTIN